MFVRTSRVKRFLRGCHRMRTRYRQIVENIERGWRKRYDTKRRELERAFAKERESLQECIRRMSTIDLESYGQMRFGVRLTFDERMMRMFDPGCEKDLIRFWAQDVGHMLEREIATLNFARFAELEHERQDKEMKQRYGNSPLSRRGAAAQRDSEGPA